MRSRLPTPDELARSARELWDTDPDGAAAALAFGLEAIEKAGTVTAAERGRLRARLGQMRIFLGDLRGATRVLYDALEVGEDGYVALQLAAALTWRGDQASLEEAEGHAGRAATVARRNRDGPLAIGALCVRGDLALAAGRPDDAVRAFGEALGISEFASSDAVSVGPLAGLSAAHLAGRAPGKAAPLARRARDRAEATGDVAGRARALIALAAAEGDAAGFALAAEAADAAPHRPLAVRARLRQVEALGVTPSDALVVEARRMGLAADVAALARLPRDLPPSS